MVVGRYSPTYKVSQARFICRFLHAACVGGFATIACAWGAVLWWPLEDLEGGRVYVPARETWPGVVTPQWGAHPSFVMRNMGNGLMSADCYRGSRERRQEQELCVYRFGFPLRALSFETILRANESDVPPGLSYVMTGSDKLWYRHGFGVGFNRTASGRPWRIALPTRILPLGFVLDSLIWGLAFAAVRWGVPSIRGKWREERGRCFRCGYPRPEGSTEPCSECGQRRPSAPIPPTLAP